MNEDVVTIEYLEDGSVKVTTDAVSGPNHMSAEKLCFARRAVGPGSRWERFRAAAGPARSAVSCS